MCSMRSGDSSMLLENESVNQCWLFLWGRKRRLLPNRKQMTSSKRAFLGREVHQSAWCSFPLRGLVTRMKWFLYHDAHPVQRFSKTQSLYLLQLWLYLGIMPNGEIQQKLLVVFIKSYLELHCSGIVWSRHDVSVRGN